MWMQPTGIADGTPEGAEWGLSLRMQLSAPVHARRVCAKIALEVQAERDDRSG